MNFSSLQKIFLAFFTAMYENMHDRVTENSYDILEDSKVLYPIQIWAPAIDVSPFDSELKQDLDYAQTLWEGEVRLWLSDEVNEKHVFTGDDGMAEALIPAKYTNIVDIFHVDRDGRLFPNLSKSVDWYKGIPSDVYLQWLTTSVVCKPKEEVITFDFPSVTANGIQKVPKTFRPSPGALMSGTVNDPHGFVKFKTLPTKGRPPISSEADSRSIFGDTKWELNRDGSKTGFVLTDHQLRTRGSSYKFQWSKPYNHMYELGTSFETISVRANITRYIKKLNEANRIQTIKQLRVISARYTGTGQAPWSHIHFLPGINANPEAQRYFLTNLEIDFNIQVERIEDLKHSREFLTLLGEQVEITCINGWTGFFVHQCLHDLETLGKIGPCKHCGRFLRAQNKNREYCTRAENQECWQDRNTVAKQKQRIRETQKRRRKGKS
jgi:hypothetical protein